MTSEREAAMWMLMGVGMMVWACVMIGCQGSLPAERGGLAGAGAGAWRVGGGEVDSASAAAGRSVDEAVVAEERAADLALVQRLSAQLERRKQEAWWQWEESAGESESLPAPAMVLGLSESHRAKFDAAGWIGLTVGGLLLLFGGEAVVVWLRCRSELAASRRVAWPADEPREDRPLPHFDQMLAYDTPLVFRLPEEPADEASSQVRSPLRRAA